MNNVSNPLVSVIISSYNHEKYVLGCLRGLFGQDYDNFEVHIRDDGSSDKTPETIKAFLNDKNNTHNIFNTFEFGENIGFVNSVNLLLKKCKGDIIMLHGSDDEYLPGRIRKAVETHQKYSDFHLVACNAQVISENGELIRQSFYNLNKKGTNENEFVIKYKDINYKSALNLGLGGFGISFKKSMLEPIGFQLPYKLLFEDGYLAFLASIKGGALIFKESLIKYRRSYFSISGIKPLLNSIQILKQEKHFFQLLLSMEESKLEYLKNNFPVNEIIERNRKSAIKFTEQKIAIYKIKISISDSNFDLKNWFKLLYLFILGPKSKYSLQILIYSLHKRKIRKLIISNFKIRELNLQSPIRYN